jgi:hypothetical protein
MFLLCCDAHPDFVFYVSLVCICPLRFCILYFSDMYLSIHILFFMFHWYAFVHYDFVFSVSLLCVCPSRFCTLTCMSIAILTLTRKVNAHEYYLLGYEKCKRTFTLDVYLKFDICAALVLIIVLFNIIICVSIIVYYVSLVL